jgi:hypothetical protein
MTLKSILFASSVLEVVEANDVKENSAVETRVDT